jgi:hypothetical protein
VPDDRKRLGLPARPFLYTLDQIASLLGVTEDYLKNPANGFCFFTGRTPGRPRPDEVRVVNLQPDPHRSPDWRVEERELIRWMKRRGFTYVDR